MRRSRTPTHKNTSSNNASKKWILVIGMWSKLLNKKCLERNDSFNNHLVYIYSQKTVQNGCHNFPDATARSSNCFFCSTVTPKPQRYSVYSHTIQKKQQILRTEKLKLTNEPIFCWKKKKRLHDFINESLWPNWSWRSHFKSWRRFKNCAVQSWDRDLESSAVHWAGQEAHRRLKVSRVLTLRLLQPCVFTAWLTDSTGMADLWWIKRHVLGLSNFSHLFDLRWMQNV